MYRAGYDPSAFVSFFEKIQALEKKKPGTISKAFDTHPQSADRIGLKSSICVAMTLRPSSWKLSPPRPASIVTPLKSRRSMAKSRSTTTNRTRSSK